MITSKEGASLLIYEKTYVAPTGAVKAALGDNPVQPSFIVGHTDDQPNIETPGEVFGLKKLLPQTLEYDVNFHVMAGSQSVARCPFIAFCCVAYTAGYVKVRSCERVLSPSALLVKRVALASGGCQVLYALDFNPGEHLNVKEIHYNQHGLMLLEGKGIYRLNDKWYSVQAGDVIWMAPYVTQWWGQPERRSPCSFPSPLKSMQLAPSSTLLCCSHLCTRIRNARRVPTLRKGTRHLVTNAADTSSSRTPTEIQSILTGCERLAVTLSSVILLLSYLEKD